MCTVSVIMLNTGTIFGHNRSAISLFSIQVLLITCIHVNIHLPMWCSHYFVVFQNESGHFPQLCKIVWQCYIVAIAVLGQLCSTGNTLLSPVVAIKCKVTSCSVAANFCLAYCWGAFISIWFLIWPEHCKEKLIWVSAHLHSRKPRG